MLDTEELQAREYFWGLRHYQPLWNRHGIPALLANKDWHKPFTCFLVVNGVNLAVMFLLSRSSWDNADFFVLTSLCALLLFDCSYLLVQFVNPGIVYSKMQPISVEREFVHCTKCGTFSEVGTSSHCEQCNVCILDLDHHCGFLGRCIGRYNRWFFYMFLLYTTVMFVNLIVTAVHALDEN